jgi:hypothetical protein
VPSTLHRISLFANNCLSETAAINTLTAYNWNLEVSVDNFFNNPMDFSSTESSSSSKTDVSKIENLFLLYKGKSDIEMSDDNTVTTELGRSYKFVLEINGVFAVDRLTVDLQYNLQRFIDRHLND